MKGAQASAHCNLHIIHCACARIDYCMNWICNQASEKERKEVSLALSSSRMSLYKERFRTIGNWVKWKNSWEKLLIKISALKFWPKKNSKKIEKISKNLWTNVGWNPPFGWKFFENLANFFPNFFWKSSGQISWSKVLIDNFSTIFLTYLLCYFISRYLCVWLCVWRVSGLINDGIPYPNRPTPLLFPIPMCGWV